MNRKTLKLGSFSLLISAIVLAAVILINVVVAALPSDLMVKDVTSTALSEISGATKNFLKTVKNKAIIYLIASTGNEDTLLLNLLQHYENGSKNVKLKQIDPATNPAFLKQYGAEQAEENSLVIVSDTENQENVRFRLIENKNLYKYSLNGETSLVDYDTALSYVQFYSAYGMTPSVEELFDGENVITSAIDYVTNPVLPNIYALSGHGETELNATLQTMFDQDNMVLTSGYSLISAGTIPEDAAVVLINVPTKDISEAERDELIAYITERDGCVLLTTAYDTKVTPEENFPNLMAVAHAMGLAGVKGYICDEDRDHYTVLSNRYYALLPEPATDGGPFRFFNAAGQTFIFLSSHAITTYSGYEGSATIYPILNTSDKGFLKLDPSTSLTKAEEDPSGAFSIAAYSVLPDVHGTGNVGTFAWYASSDIQNEQMSGYSNLELYVASVSWLAGRSSSLAIEAKQIATPSMHTVTESFKSIWTAVTVFILPLCFIGGGLAVWVLRRRK